MNIFYLDSDPQLCAQYHCDKHVVKMILETAQILSTALHLNGMNDSWLYASTHENHPCVQWAAANQTNFGWLQQLGFHLCKEYTYRYGKKHKCEWLITECVTVINHVTWPDEIVPRPQCMPSLYRDDTDCRSAYRNYYLGEKTHILKYTRRHVPDWVACMGLGEHK